MSQLQQIFEQAAGADTDAVLSTPDLSYVVELLRGAGESLSVDELEELYAAEGWLPNRSFTWLELQALQHRIHGAAHAPAGEDTAARETPHATSPNDSVATTDVNAVGPNEDGATSDHLPAAQIDTPSAVLRPFPVSVGAVGAAEQSRRRQLLARVQPADVVLTERLMATEYAHRVQGLASDIRSCLPSSPPENFRAQRYFPTLEVAVWQREEEEATEQLLADLPVHPQAGDVGHAEQQQRLSWIQTLTEEQLLEVEMLVRQKWQQQRSSAPAWMQSLLPSEAPGEFWNAEYYVCMAACAKKSEKQSERAVLPSNTRATGEPMLPPARISDCLAGITLRRAFESVPFQRRVSEGGASTKGEAETAGAIYGMDAILDGTAYEEDRMEPCHDPQVYFGGSLSLLFEAEVGARVHYEGRLVQGDPNPRELPANEALASPRKRAYQLHDGKDANTVCDVFLADNTGTVLVTLWGDLVHTWYSTLRTPAAPYIQLTNLRVAELSRTEWNGACLSRIRVLHSTPSSTLRSGTSLCRMEVPTFPFVRSSAYTPPEAPACISQFLSLQSRLRAPIRIPLRGCIDDVSEISLTQQDSKKRTFILVDGAGMWLRCCALGRCAQSHCLENGNEVVLYYGTGRSTRGSAPGMVYFIKDSLIVQIATRRCAIVKRSEIHIDGA